MAALKLGQSVARFRSSTPCRGPASSAVQRSASATGGRGGWPEAPSRRSRWMWGKLRRRRPACRPMRGVGVPFAVDHRPVPRHEHILHHRAGPPAHADALGAYLALLPLPVVQHAGRVVRVEPFHIEILRVGHRVRGAPGDARVMADGTRRASRETSRRPRRSLRLQRWTMCQIGGSNSGRCGSLASRRGRWPTVRALTAQLLLAGIALCIMLAQAGRLDQILVFGQQVGEKARPARRRPRPARPPAAVRRIGRSERRARAAPRWFTSRARTSSLSQLPPRPQRHHLCPDQAVGRGPRLRLVGAESRTRRAARDAPAPRRCRRSRRGSRPPGRSRGFARSAAASASAACRDAQAAQQQVVGQRDRPE